MLAASPTTLPLFLALSACKGPAVLSGPPPVAPQTQTLLRAVTAELNLIWIYNKTMAEYSGLRPTLAPLLAEHQAHLARLSARVIEPPGKKVQDLSLLSGGERALVSAALLFALLEINPPPFWMAAAVLWSIENGDEKRHGFAGAGGHFEHPYLVPGSKRYFEFPVVIKVSGEHIGKKKIGNRLTPPNLPPLITLAG